MDVDMQDANDLDAFASQTEAFLSWLRDNGTIISSKIEVADLRGQGAGRGVIARQDIGNDEELFSIPRRAILTVESSGVPKAVRSELDDPWLSLIVAMIYEYQQGDKSIWQHYFDILPSSFDTLMFWTPEELNYLQGSAVVDKIGKKSADEAFNEEVIPVLQRHAKALELIGCSHQDLLALCHRMGSTIMAYAFDLEKPDTESSKAEEDGWEEDEDENQILLKGMVPLADLLNADADRNNAKLFYEEDKVVMKSIKPIKAGEEIFNDYGPLPTADVLRRYGYTTENYAKYDVVEIASSLITEVAQEQLKLAEKDIEERAAYLDKQDVWDDAYDIARATSGDGQFPDELCVMLNTLALSKAEFDKLKSKDKLPKTTLSREALQLFYTVLERRRAMHDELDDKSEPSRRRLMAEQVIRGEKEVLAEAAQAVQAKLSTNKKRPADGAENDAANSQKDMKKQRAG